MIKPVFYHKKLEGKSNAHLFTFSDGNRYVVKFFQPGFEKSLPNEWIGYCLARYLQVPVPFARVLNISLDEYIAVISNQNSGWESNEEEREKGEPSLETVSGGLHQKDSNHLVLDYPEFNHFENIPYQFASLYIPDCDDGHQVTEIDHLTNASSMARIILFDYWLANQDRTRKNILFQKQKNKNYSLWAIDQAEVLGGYGWDQDKLEVLPNELIKSSAHKIMANFIETEQEFYEQLEYIQTMPILLIEEIVDLLPEEWRVTKAEKKAIVRSLLNRRRRILPKQMERFIKRIYRPGKEVNK